MQKKAIPYTFQKNKIIDNIIDAIVNRKRFLILGHNSPDEDCIASMVSFALILSKFSKEVSMCLGGFVHEHFDYLLNICKYNSIGIITLSPGKLQSFDTVVVCDTPKRSMIEPLSVMEPLLADSQVIVIEVDHHLGADSEYIGDSEYSLVTESSSSCELICHIACKLRDRKELLGQFQIEDIFSRNLVLAMLTGIVGDTNMGQYLKSRREKKYYYYFSTMLNEILVQKTVRESNFANKDQIFNELQRHSNTEEKCFQFIMGKKQSSPSIAYSVLSASNMERLLRTCDNDTFVSVSRSAANELAEQSGKLGLVVYFDNHQDANLVQFRLRRSHSYKEFDLRSVLTRFSIENGGGHEGAIGFRVPQDQIKDVNVYISGLIDGIEKII